MGTIAKTNQKAICEAFAARIITKIPQHFADANVWFDDSALPASGEWPNRDHAIAIVPGDGEFDQGMQLGGGPCAIVENATTSVAIYKRNSRDVMRELDQVLFNTDDGLLSVYKRLVLKAILRDENNQPWVPVDVDGNNLLHEGIRVLSSVGPQRLTEWPLTMVVLTFYTAFNWDLS